MKILRVAFFISFTLGAGVSCFGISDSPIRYFSQFKQDQFIHQNFFINKTNGIFVDIGAHDGISLSNSLFFERFMGWHGICVEPMADAFNKLRNNRKAICVNGAIGHETGVQKFLKISSPRIETEMLSGLINKYDKNHINLIEREILQFGGSYEIIEVNCYTLIDILQENSISHIDYLSIDTEGGEYEILRSIDFSKIAIAVIDIENNYNDSRIRSLLEKNGYEFVVRIVCDDIYRKI